MLVYMEGKALNRMAVVATLHCLTGCAIGEVLGAVIGSALGWHNLATVLLAIGLAFFFGYLLTFYSLRKHHMTVKAKIKVALAADTVSITVMEIVDNAIILLIPGALMSGPTTLLFWSSLALALAIAFICAVPVNRALIARGKGHAVAHHH